MSEPEVLTAERVAELRELLARATPAPWCWAFIGEKVNGYVLGYGCDISGKPVSGRVDDREDVVETLLNASPIGEIEGATCNYNDPDLIVAMRNALPALLAAHARAASLERELAEARATNQALNRRAQQAESQDEKPALLQSVADVENTLEYVKGKRNEALRERDAARGELAEAREDAESRRHMYDEAWAEMLRLAELAGKKLTKANCPELCGATDLATMLLIVGDIVKERLGELAEARLLASGRLDAAIKAHAERDCVHGQLESAHETVERLRGELAEARAECDRYVERGIAAVRREADREAERDAARETNQSLNRRVGELESQLARDDNERCGGFRRDCLELTRSLDAARERLRTAEGLLRRHSSWCANTGNLANEPGRSCAVCLPCCVASYFDDEPGGGGNG